MGFMEQVSKKPEHVLPADLSLCQLGADSSIILEFVALRVKTRGDSAFVL